MEAALGTEAAPPPSASFGPGLAMSPESFCAVVPFELGTTVEPPLPATAAPVVVLPTAEFEAGLLMPVLAVDGWDVKWYAKGKNKWEIYVRDRSATNLIGQVFLNAHTKTSF